MTDHTNDLDAIEDEFLQICGPCDGGVPMGCSCPTRDYRGTMSALVNEVRDLRETLSLRSDALNRTAETNDQLRAALTDYAQHGLRFDMMPTHRPGDEEFWHHYLQRIDASVRARARAALGDEEP